jgi:aminocarboxymuconate-semialdehyde decarboxylase
MITIDMHSHVGVPEAAAMVAEKEVGTFASMSAASAAHQKKLVAELKEQLHNPERRIADMDEAGIDMSIISMSPMEFFYHLEEEQAAALARKQNDQIAEIVRKYPKRFVGMSTVPMKYPAAAVKELERSVKELGMKGVEVCSNVRGDYLGEDKFLPFFEKAAALDIPIFVHPSNVAAADRTKFFYLNNLIGNPLDTTIAAAQMIFKGLFDRFPDLKIVLSHAGGMVPWNIDRWDRGYKVRPECAEFIKKSPGEYLKSFYYDTITHGPETLRFLISRVGIDRVVMATDYPYDMGDLTPLQSLAAAGLSAEETEKIASTNTIALFKLA